MLICQTEEFIRTLDKVIDTIERSSIQPILEHVLVEISEDGLTLLAADGVTHVRARLPLKKSSRKKNEQFCVSGSKLRRVLGSMISKSVSFRLSGHNLHIQPAEGDKAGKADDRGFRLSTRPGEEFPRENVSHKPATEIKFDQIRLLTSINRLMPAVATEIHRQYLTGMYFDFDGELLRLVATDGHRMGVDELTRVKTDKFGIIIPRKAMDLLRRVLSDEGGEPVKMVPLTDDDGRKAAVRFEIAEVRITAALIDATYPDYMKVLPTENDAEAVFGHAELRDVLGQVATVLDRNNDAITLGLAAGGGASLSAKGAQTNDEATLDLAADYEGPARTSKFSCAYLTDMVKAFEGREKIRIMFKHERESVLCESVDAKEEKDTLKYVLMPIRI